MKNIKRKFLIFIFFFIFFYIGNIQFCYALNYKGKINSNDVNIRKGPGVSYERITSLIEGGIYNLVDNNLVKDEGGCENGWYRLYYEDDKIGYVCGKYVDVSEDKVTAEAKNECEQQLKDSGFPESYWQGLCNLKINHPNWEFKPIITNLDWSTAVNKESACGKSYISTSDPKYIDSTCKNAYTSVWYPASSLAVAYYMDPRNWLSENTIFQFEYLKFSDTLKDKYKDAVVNIIKNAEFYKYHLSIGNDLGSIITEASEQAMISPIFVSSRILQELGNKNSLYNLYSGVYEEKEGYKGYYNFYNFGVSDSCATSKGASICGLEYAKSRGWDSLYNAIYGGASDIASSYISVGQYSGYLQKFNVVPTNPSKLYVHQYMTNIAAPSSEAKTTYKSYNTMGIIDSNFIFFIPVYNNMDNSNYEEQNGATPTPDEDIKTSIDINTIIVSSGYKYASGQISGIPSNTSVSTVKSTIESIAGAKNVQIKDSKDNIISDGLIGTGFKVIVSNSEKSETLTVIINGDTSGDGKINALDLLQVQKSILGTYTLSGEYYLAGDTSDDGKINALDLLQVQKSILGTYTIEE